MEQRGVCDRLKEIPLKRRKSCVGTHQINKLETQHGTYTIVICYGVGKRYSRYKLLWSETTLGFETRFILCINRQSFYRNRKRQLVPTDRYRSEQSEN